MPKPKLNPDRYRVRPGKLFHLAKVDPSADDGWDKELALEALAPLQKRFTALAENLYAEHRRSLLVVLQGMDAAGKDSTVRQVFAPLDPASCHVRAFKAPHHEEASHDFLWRIHHWVPSAGHVGVFNRSHYEDAVIARINKLVPAEKLAHRIRHIRNFEDLLSTEGTVVVKFFLHISKAYQKERLLKRLRDPAKRWKFDPADILERRRWGTYMQVYGDIMAQTASDDSPWYAIPAENRPYRNLLITRVLVDQLERMAPKPRKISFPQARMLRELGG